LFQDPDKVPDLCVNKLFPTQRGASTFRAWISVVDRWYTFQEVARKETLISSVHA
jgi:hypothetical protein